ncbi:MAG: hypothetical protein AVDCRST_MAG39-523, partial [uncultured Sphingomonadaceae bacterium]
CHASRTMTSNAGSAKRTRPPKPPRRRRPRRTGKPPSRRPPTRTRPTGR